MNDLATSQKNPQPLQQPQSKEDKRIAAVLHSYRESFSGPLPPPEILLKYEQTCKGAAHRIIKMAENQSIHRQELERKVIKSNISNERIGMNYTFLLTIALIISGVILSLFDKKIESYFALFGPTVWHAGNYVYRKYIEKEEPKRKEREIKNAKNRKRER